MNRLDLMCTTKGTKKHVVKTFNDHNGIVLVYSDGDMRYRCVSKYYNYRQVESPVDLLREVVIAYSEAETKRDLEETIQRVERYLDGVER